MPCEALGISFLFEDLRVAPSPTRHDCGKARAGDLDRVVIDFRPWEVTFTLTPETIKFCSPISELISLTRELAPKKTRFLSLVGSACIAPHE
jgi:hypothetical protein